MSARGRLVYTYARRHWSGDDAVTATAIALCESGGNPLAYNPRPPDLSYGLWQINMRGDLGPARRSQYNLDRNSQLLNPITNARVAFGVYQDAGNSFRPWTCFTNGGHRKHINEARESAGLGPIKDPESMVEPTDFGIFEPIAGPIGDIADLVGFITDPKNWQRVAMFVGGGLLIIVATVIFAGEQALGSGVVRALPGVGRAARTVRRMR